MQRHLGGDLVQSVFIRKWVAPILALIVPKGCSTVLRRCRIFFRMFVEPALHCL